LLKQDQSRLFAAQAAAAKGGICVALLAGAGQGA